MAKVGVTTHVHPIQAGGESNLRIVAGLHRLCSRANVARPADGYAAREHEVDQFSHARLLGSRRIIFRNDHLGEMLDHAVLLG